VWRLPLVYPARLGGQELIAAGRVSTAATEAPPPGRAWTRGGGLLDLDDSIGDRIPGPIEYPATEDDGARESRIDQLPSVQPGQPEPEERANRLGGGLRHHDDAGSVGVAR
jgi:hypothetical protein